MDADQLRDWLRVDAYPESSVLTTGTDFQELVSDIPAMNTGTLYTCSEAVQGVETRRRRAGFDMFRLGHCFGALL